LPATIHEGAAAVYIPSCTNRIFGSSSVDGPEIRPYGGKAARQSWVVEALVEVSARAGLPVWIPEAVVGSCCGLPWSSKGFGDAHRHKANEMVERLWEWSGEGALPIVIDAASCTSSIAEPGDGVLDEENAERLGKLQILDSVAWAHDRLLPWLEVAKRVGSATVHPTCATRHMGLTHRLEALADALADDVFIPPTATCCGFAGDRGISHPELTGAATAPQAAELAGRYFDARLSSNRTCEIGLERATGEPYESVILLLERLTRAAVSDS
jgi:D-lactate dehydrogenase